MQYNCVCKFTFFCLLSLSNKDVIIKVIKNIDRVIS